MDRQQTEEDQVAQDITLSLEQKSDNKPPFHQQQAMRLAVPGTTGFQLFKPEHKRQGSGNIPRPGSKEIKVAIESKFNHKCQHGHENKDQKKKYGNLIGDAHLVNCNQCGAYFPKSGTMALRAKKRFYQMNKLYTSDILRNIYSRCQQKQGNKEQHLKISAQYVEVRNLIIDWLVEVSETLNLDINKSAYHSVIILDRYLSSNLRRLNKEMDQTGIMLQALCCLFIAAKNLEKDPLVPSSRKFLRQLPGFKPSQLEQNNDLALYNASVNQLSGQHAKDNLRFNSKKNDLVAQETVILNELGFDLDTYPTYFDVVEVFMAQGCLYTTDQMNSRPLTKSEDQELAVKRIEKHIDFFILLSLQDHKLVNTNQYLIACSIVSAARLKVGITPHWSTELEQLTGLQHSHFCNIEKRLLTKFDQHSGADKNKRLQDTVKRPKKVDDDEEDDGLQTTQTNTIDNRTAEQRNHQAELNGSAIILSNQVPQQQAQTRINVHQAPQDGERNVSRSNLLGKHQESTLFNKMVQDNHQKYEEIIKKEQQTLHTNSAFQKQQEIRTKYGSKNAKQKMAVILNENRPASQQSNKSTDSNSNIIRMKQQNSGAFSRQKSLQVTSDSQLPQQDKFRKSIENVEPVVGSRQNGLIQVKQSAMGRYAVHQAKPSSVSSNPMQTGSLQDYLTTGVNSSRGTNPNSLQPMATNRNAPGTVLIKQAGGPKHQQLYSRELSNVKQSFAMNSRTGANSTSHGIRNSSQNSQGSTNGNFSRFNKTQLQSSEQKSLVRQALKNQRRNQKIGVEETSVIRPLGGNIRSGSNNSQNPVSRAAQAQAAISQRSTYTNGFGSGAKPKIGHTEPGVTRLVPGHVPSLSTNASAVKHPQHVRQLSGGKQIGGIGNSRSLSQSGQKIVGTNSAAIKNKIRNMRDASQHSNNSHQSQGLKMSQGQTQNKGMMLLPPQANHLQVSGLKNKY